MTKSPWDDDFEKKKDFFSSKKTMELPNFNFFGKGKIVYLLFVILMLWLASGIYKVQEGEEALVIRFGKFVRMDHPGLNYHLPEPVEEVIIEKVNQSRRIEIGYRSANKSSRKQEDFSKSINSESSMLTGDENIVDLNCDVMWHIHNLQDYVFNIVGQEETVKTASESAIRDIMGQTLIASILSNERQEIANKIASLTQKILDKYNSGIQIEKVQLLKAEPPAEVIDAYRDVQTSKADKEKSINQALSYKNDVLPKARGEAAKMIEEAEAYKHRVTSRADGDSKRFIAIYKEYSNNKQVMKDRLYLDTMAEILQNAKKYIVTSDTFQHLAIENSEKRIK